MKKETQYFRIIELPTHQVLLTRDFDEDESDIPLLAITIFHGGVKMTTSLGFGEGEEEKRDKAFDDFNNENAQSVLNVLLGLAT